MLRNILTSYVYIINRYQVSIICQALWRDWGTHGIRKHSIGKYSENNPSVQNSTQICQLSLLLCALWMPTFASDVSLAGSSILCTKSFLNFPNRLLLYGGMIEMYDLFPPPK